MTNRMDALALIRTQHDEADALFTALHDATGPERRRAHLTELMIVMIAHMQIEERLLYPAVFTDELEAKLREATEEHLSIKRLLADLDAMPPDDPQFEAKVKVAMEQVEHHARVEEEAELFPKIRARVSQGQLDALGVEMLRSYETLIGAGSPHVRAGELRSAAPL